MTHRVALQSAFVLHRRAFRETSFLVDLFTEKYGRITVLAKGAKTAKSSRPGLLQGFSPLLVSWSGRGELPVLSHIELKRSIPRLVGESLLSGLYLNELLMRLLHPLDACSELFRRYEAAIVLLGTSFHEGILRSFEKYLLQVLGYGLLIAPLHYLPEAYYRFMPGTGFVLSESDHALAGELNLFLGRHLLAIANEEWQDLSVLQDAKRLMRLALQALFGDKPLYSRTVVAKIF